MKCLFIGGPLNGEVQEVDWPDRDVVAPWPSDPLVGVRQPAYEVIPVIAYRPCRLHLQDMERVVYVARGIHDADVLDRVRQYLFERFMREGQS
jgi:hypothetical protein